jgi:hypothetical protein
VCAFDAKKHFRWPFVVMDGDVQRAQAGDAKCLSGVNAASGEGTALTTFSNNFCVFSSGVISSVTVLVTVAPALDSLLQMNRDTT